jgi:hypothetical protein
MMPVGTQRPAAAPAAETDAMQNRDCKVMPADLVRISPARAATCHSRAASPRNAVLHDHFGNDNNTGQLAGLSDCRRGELISGSGTS